MTKLKIICLVGLALLAIAPIKIQSASATIHLPGDCNAYGIWNEETKTCVLNQDLGESVEIKADNITLDCADRSIKGRSISSGYGLYLNHRTGVSITNCNVNNFSKGIYLYHSNGNKFIDNIVSGNFDGVYLYYSDFNALTNNTVNSNRNFGIVHYYSSNNTLTKNTMSGNRYNFSLSGWEDADFTNYIDTSNLVDGKPIYYLLNAEDQVFGSSTNAGIFYCINCNNITIKNLTLAKNDSGIFFKNTHNSKIENIIASDNHYYGIYLANSTDNTIINSDTLNNSSGIYLAGSANNTIIDNNILDNSYGIYPVSSANNTIADNDISNNEYGIHLSNNNTNNSDNNTIAGNDISNNSEFGICFRFSNDNIITGNIFSNNKRGVFVYSGHGNKIYHNNFIGNLLCHASGKGIFDNGYPSGGNYWSGWSGIDEKSGLSQNQPNGDGIGDTAYIFNDGQDNYPFMEENGWEAMPSQPPTISNLNQFKSDEVTPIIEGAITNESVMVFKATLDDPNNNQVKLQVELREADKPLTGIDDGEILNSDLVASGSEATITRYGLINGEYHWQARVVNSQGAVSEWQEFGVAGNMDFEIKTVPLYTQVRSPYPFRTEEEEWANNDYAKGFDYGCGSTIAGCGCAITSMIMIGRFYDIDTGIDNSSTDPKNINNWLNNNHGYSGPNLYWSKAVEYLGYVDNGKKMAKLSFDYYNEPSGSSLIDEYVDNAKPIVAYSNVYGHYFVIDGKLKINNVDTYTVKDPYWYNTKTLNDRKNIGEKVQGYNNYFTKANLFSYLKMPKKIAASMHIYLASPAELLVTDPEGRKLGKDPINNGAYNDIPDSSYTMEGAIISSDNPLDEIHEKKVIYIPNPINGPYDIQVIGTGEGGYTLTSLIYDDKGDSKETVQKNSTVKGDVQEFELDYSKQDVEETKTCRFVDIDIKPHSKSNIIKIRPWGVTRVAILSDQFFDAREVDINSVLFAGASPLMKRKIFSRWRFRDIDKDGDLDLILYFRTRSLNLSPTDTEAVLTGKLNDGTFIKGSDSVKIINRHNKNKHNKNKWKSILRKL